MQKPNRPITRSEHNRILALAPSTEFQHFLALLFDTGLRPLDCLALNAEDIDWLRQEIVIRPRKYGGSLTASLPITTVVANTLQALPVSGALFPRLRRQPLSQITKRFLKLCRAAGFTGLSGLHSYRVRHLEEA